MKGTVGLRFTVLYAAVFVASAAGLLALTFLISNMSDTSPAPDQQLATDPGQRIRDLQRALAEADTQNTRQLLIGSVIALVVMAVVSLVLGRALAGRVLRPLRLITAATRRISADNLHQRLAVRGPTDEVKDLADTIDGLLERLEAAFAAQRRFVANAAHELRTPLTTMRASLDVAVAKPEPAAQTVALADRMRTQLDQLDGLLDGLLALARAQHASPTDATTVDLAELVASALATRPGDRAPRRLRPQNDTSGDTRTHGNPALLARLVDNVIDNAVVHNEPDGWIHTVVTGDRSEVRLVVESGGPVLDPQQVARLGRPFERLGADRTRAVAGSGLGLSIVAAIVALHGGRLDLAARAEGGLRVEIVLPAWAVAG